tara:strand:- start:45 stop:221 length:177 start_codon:yes stop_codon:yes gene_type:complete
MWGSISQATRILAESDACYQSHWRNESAASGQHAPADWLGKMMCIDGRRRLTDRMSGE